MYRQTRNINKDTRCYSASERQNIVLPIILCLLLNGVFNILSRKHICGEKNQIHSQARIMEAVGQTP